MGKGDVKIAIVGDPSSAVAAFEQVGGAGNLFQGVIQGMGMAVGQELLTLGVKFASFATDSISKFEDLAVATRKVMRQTGLGAEESSKLIEVARDSGVAYEDLTKSLKIFDKKLESGSVGGYTDSLKDQSKTAAEVTQAQDELNRATQHLADVQAVQHSKSHLTVQDSITLRNANQAVADAQAHVAKATSGTGDALAGVSIVTRDAQGNLLPMTEILGNVADKFKDLGDGAQATALAQKLFGKSGETMLPLLQQGKEGIAEITDEMDKYGLTLDQAGVEKGLAAKKATRELGMAFEGVQIILGQALAPILTDVTKWIGENLPGAIASAKVWLKEHEQDFKDIGTAIINAFTWAKDNLPGILSTAKDYVTQFVDGCKTITGWYNDNKTTIDAIIDFGKSTGAAFNDAGTGLIWFKDNVLDPLIGSLQTAVTTLDDLANKTKVLKDENGGGGFDVTLLFPGLGQLVHTLAGKGNATGGYLPDGPGLVGENGPERTFTQGGKTYVTPNQQSGSSAAPQVIEVHAHTYVDGREVSHTIRRQDLALT